MSSSTEPHHHPSSVLTTRRAALPHPAPHHHQMLLARTPSRARRLALGMCLAASLALSACGPAHKGQLKVEPADASAEASAEASESSSPTPSKSPSPTASASTPSPSATTWTAPSVTVSSEDSSVWTHDDERIKKDSAGPNGTIDGYTVNANPACFGYVSTSAEERYYSLRGVGDDIQSKAALKSQQTIFPDIRRHRARTRWRPSGTTVGPSRAMRRPSP